MMVHLITVGRVNVHRERMCGHFPLLHVLAKFHHQPHELIDIEGIVGELGMMRSHGGVLPLLYIMIARL